MAATDPANLEHLQRELRRATECLRAKDPAGMLEALYASGVLEGLNHRLAAAVPDLDSAFTTDIVADVTGELYEKAARGGRIDNLAGWMWKAAFRKAMVVVERQRSCDEIAEEETPGEHPRTGAEPASDFVVELRAAVQDLPAGRVRAAVSHVAEREIEGHGWSYEDLSAALGVTIGNASTIMTRGRSRLRQIFEGRGLMRRSQPDELADSE